MGGGLGLPVPEDLTLLAAGVLAHEHAFRLPDAIVVGLLGVAIPDWIIYLAGRRYGATLLEHPFLARRVGATRLDTVRRAVARHGGRAVFAARFVLGFRFVTFFSAGSFHVPVLRFAVAEGAATAIFVPAMITLGFLFSDQVERLAHDASRVRNWLLLAGLVGLALYLGLRAWFGRTGLGSDQP